LNRASLAQLPAFVDSVPSRSNDDSLKAWHTVLDACMRLTAPPTCGAGEAAEWQAACSVDALIAVGVRTGGCVRVVRRTGLPIQLHASVDSGAVDTVLQALRLTATSAMAVIVLPSEAFVDALAHAPDAVAVSSTVPTTCAFVAPAAAFAPCSLQSEASSGIATYVSLSCLTDMDVAAALGPERALQLMIESRPDLRVAPGMLLFAGDAVASAVAHGTTMPSAAERSVVATADAASSCALAPAATAAVFRVEAVRGQGGRVDPAKTEVALVGFRSQPDGTASSPTATPVVVPTAVATPVGAVMAATPNFAALATAFAASRSTPPGIELLVVHGSPQNGGDAFTRAALACAGRASFELDARLVDAPTAAAFAQRIVADGIPSAVLVLRHCDALEATSEIGRTLVAAAAGETWAISQLQGADADASSAHLTVVMVFGGVEAPPSFYTSVASWPCFTVATPDDSGRTRVVQAVLSSVAASSAESGVAVSRACPAALLAAWAVGLGVLDIYGWMTQTFRRAASRYAENALGGAEHDAAADHVGSGVADAKDFEETLKAFQQQHGHDLTSTKLQPVKWSDVGGLEDAKREILETIELPLKHPELFRKGAKQRAGVLMYGPPGCGKTLLAKAVATEMGLNFISVKGPELINPYVGESEKNIRQLFQKARDNSPCIAFFDELDALAPKRGAKGDSGGVMDRIVAQLLAEVDGVGAARSDGTAAAQVFIVGATNRPDLLDPSLIRPGRFDRPCYLGPPATKQEQLSYVEALTRKFDLAADVDLRSIIEPLPPSVFTGADYFALCSDAMMLAVDARVEAITRSVMESPDGRPDPALENTKVRVSMADFVAARSRLSPSVSVADLKRYEAVRDQFASGGQ
jgi:hypothetical protein